MKIVLYFVVFISTFGPSLSDHTFFRDNGSLIRGCCSQTFGRGQKPECGEKAKTEVTDSYVDKKYKEDIANGDFYVVQGTMERYVSAACTQVKAKFGDAITGEQFGFLLVIGSGTWVEKDDGIFFSKLKENFTGDTMNQAMTCGASYWQKLSDKNFDFIQNLSEVKEKILEKSFVTFYEDYVNNLTQGKINNACKYQELLTVYETCKDSSSGKIGDDTLALLKQKCT